MYTIYDIYIHAYNKKQSFSTFRLLSFLRNTYTIHIDIFTYYTLYHHIINIITYD